MNRPIKFRGKHLDLNIWAYGDLLQYNEGSVAIGTHGRYTDDGYSFNDCWNETPYVDEDTIGQFTGLLDRNGREIYEGDILERYNEQGMTMHVNWFGSQFGCVQHWDGVDGEGSWYPLDNYCTEEWEVIGNIHDQSKS